MVREAGAKEIHVRISCPPTISPCYYGIDTPNKADLIAAQMSVEEICKFIEADSLGYLSLDGMIEAIGISPDSSCVACWNEEVSDAHHERSGNDVGTRSRSGGR